MSLEQAAVSCLSEEVAAKIGDASPEEIIRICTEVSRSVPGSNYLSDRKAEFSPEHTLATAGDHIQNGFSLRGNRYTLSCPFDWSGPESAGRNHRFKIQSWTMLDMLLGASTFDHDEEFVTIPFDIAIDWVNNHVIDSHGGDFSWYDMSVGLRANKISYILNRVMRDHTRVFGKQHTRHQDMLKLIVAAEIHFVELMDESKLAVHSNHGFFQMAGLLALGSSLGFMEKSSAAVRLSDQMISKMLDEHFTQDGLHKEHSPNYHFLLTTYLHQLLETKWITKGSALESRLVRSEQISSNLVMPDGRLLPLGDTRPENANDLVSFRINRDADGRICPRNGLHVFPSGGLVIHSIHDDEGRAKDHLAFSAQFHSRQHKHADNLGFNYCMNGRQMIIDSGTYSYHYEQPERMYIESTRAHNTVEIDGLNHSRFLMDVYGSALTLACEVGPCVVMEGRVHHKRLAPPDIPNNRIRTTDAVDVDVQHRRLLLHVSDRFLLVLDDLKSDESHEYTQWFHLAPDLDFKIGIDDMGLVVDKKNRAVSAVRSVESDAEITLTLIKGQKTPQLQGWVSLDGQSLTPNQAIGIRTNASSTVIATLFDFKIHGTKKPYLKIGTRGRYIRFSIIQDSEKIDFIMREDPEGGRSIECSVGDKSFQKTIPADVIAEEM
jgi:hypothetical protein